MRFTYEIRIFLIVWIHFIVRAVDNKEQIVYNKNTKGHCDRRFALRSIWSKNNRNYWNRGGYFLLRLSFRSFKYITSLMISIITIIRVSISPSVTYIRITPQFQIRGFLPSVKRELTALPLCSTLMADCCQLFYYKFFIVFCQYLSISHSQSNRHMLNPRAVIILFKILNAVQIQVLIEKCTVLCYTILYNQPEGEFYFGF